MSRKLTPEEQEYQAAVAALQQDKGNYTEAGNIGANNASAIAASEVFGVSNLLTALSIVVEGQDILHYKKFKLSQSATKHHRFMLVLDHDVLGIAEDHWLEKSKDLLGKRITVVFSYRGVENTPKRVFVGVITNVGFTREYGNRGHIVLEGSDPTVLMDAAPNLQTFGGDHAISLQSIGMYMMKQGLDVNLYAYRVDTKYVGNVPYSCQYNETHYNYLARIAAIYGEQFYYDGETLQFGMLPTPNQTLTLTFGKDVDRIKLSMKTRHVNRMMLGYNSSENRHLSSVNTPLQHKSSLAQDAYATSQQTYKTESIQVAPLRAVIDQDVEAAQRNATARAGVEVFTTRGETTVPFLYPGCVADMYLRKPGSMELSYSTRLMITKVKHEVDELGNYRGKFEAIAADTGFLPAPKYKMPVAEPQIAMVIANDDPLGQGRVRVQFGWQKMGDTTAWIRVMAPHAGSSKTVGENRGFVSVPEVGDQVMVGFLHGHPDRPFVMGGMFHGQNGIGGGLNNAIKSWMTSSGIKAIFNDDEGSVHIEDPSGNIWHMDGQKNITVTAPQNIALIAGATFTLNAKNLQIAVQENMGTSVGKSQQNAVGENMEITANKLDENYANDVTTNIGGKNTLQANESESLISGDMVVQASGRALVEGAQDARISKKG